MVVYTRWIRITKPMKNMRSFLWKRLCSLKKNLISSKAKVSMQIAGKDLIGNNVLLLISKVLKKYRSESREQARESPEEFLSGDHPSQSKH